MKAAIYARVSSDEQREKGSIATQRAELTRYCEREGIVPVEEYADDGITGTIALEDRPAGRRMLDDARHGAFDTLFVFKLDRIGREPWVTLKALHDLETAGITVRSITESFDRSEPAGRFMSTILSGAAGHERDNIVERSRAGVRRAAREGRWVGGSPPYGYAVDRSNRRAYRLVVVEAAADVIRMIYGMAVEGQTCTQIAVALERRGVPTVKGRPWGAGRVRNLLASTTYKGLHSFGKRAKKRPDARPVKREIITRPVPAIVSPEVWEAAQRTLANNRLNATRNLRAENHYLLRGMIRCAGCGLRFTARAVVMENGRRLNYYRCGGCSANRKIDPCGPRRCNAAPVGWQLEDAVWSEVAGFVRNPGTVLAELERQMRQRGGEAWNGQREVADVNALLKSKATERDRILDLYRRGTVEIEMLDGQMAKIDAEERALREQLQAVEDRIGQARGIRAELHATGTLLRRLRAKLNHPDFATRRSLVESFVKSITVETKLEGGKRIPLVDVVYRFEDTPSVASRTPRGSSPTTAAPRPTA